MEREPILNLRLIANKQGLETIKPSVGMFNNRTPFVEFLVKITPLYPQFMGRPGVERNVGLNLSAGTSQAQTLGVKPTIGIEKQALEINLGRFQQAAQFLKKLLDLEQIVR